MHNVSKVPTWISLFFSISKQLHLGPQNMGSFYNFPLMEVALIYILQMLFS